MLRTSLFASAAIFVSSVCPRASSAADAKPLRIGIIGLDTSHCPEFVKILNDPKAAADVAGCRVVAAYPGGSADIPSSINRVGKFTAEVKAQGVEIVDSIDALLPKVDAAGGAAGIGSIAGRTSSQLLPVLGASCEAVLHRQAVCRLRWPTPWRFLRRPRNTISPEFTSSSSPPLLRRSG